MSCGPAPIAVSRRRAGQPQHHGQAAAGRGLRGDAAAHRLGEAAGQGEAEPDAGLVVPVAEALERQEDVLPLVLGDAGAGVDDPQLDLPGVGAGGDVGGCPGGL